MSIGSCIVWRKLKDPKEPMLPRKNEGVTIQKEFFGRGYKISRIDCNGEALGREVGQMIL